MLARILEHKKIEVAERQKKYPLVANDLGHGLHARPFAASLRQHPSPALIAEIKWASPSAGTIRPLGEPEAIAKAYAENGAAAISVLTDTLFFRGHVNHLRAVRRAVNLPILRKDFIINPYQVRESRMFGADALLLIVAAIDHVRLAELFRLTLSLGMEALVEVHDENELTIAMEIGATLIGINNRNLKTMHCNPQAFHRLAALVPPGITLVAASGITSRSEAQSAAAAGAHAVLVGQALMGAPDIRAKVREFTGYGEVDHG